MTVKLVEAKDARPRLKIRGRISGNADYSSIIAHLPAVIRENKAIEVELDLDKGFPEVSGDRKKIPFLFCASLRRYFANNGLAAECYQSGPALITVKKAQMVPHKPVQKRK